MLSRLEELAEQVLEDSPEFLAAVNPYPGKWNEDESHAVHLALCIALMFPLHAELHAILIQTGLVRGRYELMSKTPRSEPEFLSRKHFESMNDAAERIWLELRDQLQAEAAEIPDLTEAQQDHIDRLCEPPEIA